MRTLKLNTAQLAFIADHPKMARDYRQHEEEKVECKCKEPDLAFSKPSMKTDGTYFQFCKQCLKFKDVPAPEQIVRELIF